MSDLIPCPFCGDPMEYWAGTSAIRHTRMTAKCILGDQAFVNVQMWNTRAADIDAIRRDARNDALIGWQPIETAPKDGTPVDLWGVNHLHYAKRGERLTNVKFGTVTDWLGNEREDWETGRGEDFEPTHWMSLPEPPAMIEDKP